MAIAVSKPQPASRALADCRRTHRLQAVVFSRHFADCFTDHRNPVFIEHTVNELISQRIYGLALGYENLNDHDQLRYDPLFAVMVGKRDPTGKNRFTQPDQGKPLAGKRTLNRLELTPVRATRKSRYKKITADRQKIQQYFLDIFFNPTRECPSES